MDDAIFVPRILPALRLLLPNALHAHRDLAPAGVARALLYLLDHLLIIGVDGLAMIVLGDEERRRRSVDWDRHAQEFVIKLGIHGVDGLDFLLARRSTSLRSLLCERRSKIPIRGGIVVLFFALCSNHHLLEGPFGVGHICHGQMFHRKVLFLSSWTPQR